MIEVAVIIIALALLPLAWRTLCRGLAVLDTWTDLLLVPWGAGGVSVLGLMMAAAVAVSALCRACGLTEDTHRF